MEIKGSYQLPCDPQRAWEALNDPELLKACLKGCERLEKTADDRFEGTVQAKVGPVAARFSGSLTQTEIDAPNGCTMVFEGQGGVAGFAKGSANVSLEAVDGGTQLSYDADAKIGGKLAQMGARLVEGTARSMAEDFFSKFSVALGAVEGSADGAKTAPETGPVQPEQQAATGSKLTWFILASVAVVLLVLYWLR
ncbi:carbon monoxide dehydrogenase subunit G [uncultured Erythrobacter sp.]|uniref:CoxG family protein n=1 Tax=uncultured Erythrobacter sp. TaxID=263913 RepID=UPI00260FDD25|nr:carbon monoxide dehydrogenase subunit G [uncultured Erythrobacter sp.]